MAIRMVSGVISMHVGPGKSTPNISKMGLSVLAWNRTRKQANHYFGTRPTT